MRNVVIILAFILTATSVMAQKAADTTKKTVVVTSAFKPSLKPAAKINFSAATPVIDSTKLNLEYNVPSQNLFFTYQPVSLKPLAISVDTGINWRNDNYIKAGFGNYSTPYLQTGLSFGDGQTSVVNLHAKHISSKGNLPFQQYSKTNAEVIGVFNSDGINEWRGSIGYDKQNQYRYGYQPDSIQFSKSDLRQRFTTVSTNVGLRNKEQTNFGISYNPSLALSYFDDNRNGREVNAILNAPITKTFGKAFAINLGFTADITNYKSDFVKNKNNLYYLTPSLQLKSPNFIFTGGVNPTWDNQLFSLLPNFSVTAKLQDETLMLEAGWVSYFNKNTYQSLAAYNPFIQQPTRLVNTRVKEQYAGFKGSIGNHLTYNTRLSILNYSNAVLFRNDTVFGNTFEPLFEPRMRAITIHPEIGYTYQEKFSFLAGAKISTFSNQQVYQRAYGLLPFELTGALRWQVMKDLHLKSDIFFFQGAPYQQKDGDNKRLKPGVDLNAGLEFIVLPKLNLWVQFNNMLNDRYHRWNQYEVLGFNVLGGIVYSFSQNK